MSDPVSFKYRAFLSYSHKNTRAAKKLHKGLEGFRIDKDLRGRETSAGVIPKTLRPIFRDREDFSAGHSLTGQTLAALEASPFMILVCSPAAAQSPYVNEEVRLFKAMGRGDNIIPVIVDGEPGDPERECFPPALRFELNADGSISDRPLEVLAADVREQGDGFALALAKSASRLMGLSTDEVYKRAERARRRSARIRNSVMGALLLLTVAAMGSAAYAYHLLTTNEEVLIATLKTASEMVDTVVEQSKRSGIPKSFTLKMLQQAEGLFDHMARLGRQTSEMKRQKAWMLIQFGRNYEALGDTAKQREYAARAEKLMRSLDNSGGGGLLERHVLFASLSEAGDAALARGERRLALKKYSEGLKIMKELASAYPDRTDIQRELSVSHEKIGNVLLAAGKRAEALVSYRASLVIRERLALSDPGNAGWQRDLSVSHNKIGNVLLKAGKRAEALVSYRASHAIFERLALSDPGNAGWQRDLSVSHERIGDVLRKAGKRAEALVSYRARHVIAERLALSDAGNAGWQRDLSVSHEKIGDVLLEAGKRAEALVSYRARHVIAERLALSDAGNAGWQKDVAWSYWRLAGLSDKPAVEWRKVVEIMRKMNREGKLAPVDEKWLPMAEKNLAKALE